MPTQLVNSTEQINSRTLGGRLFLPFGIYTEISPLTANGSSPFSATIDRTMTPIKWAQGVYVITTNDGSNYWTIEMKKLSDFSVINSINTSAISPDVSALLTDSTFSVATLGASDVGVYIYCTKVGAPGALFIFGPAMEVSVP